MDSKSDQTGKQQKTKRVSRYKQAKILVVVMFFVSLLLFALTLVGLGYFIATQTNPRVAVERQKQTIATEGEVIADVAQSVSPSVVSIVTEQRRVVNSYFGRQSATGQAAGTGVVIDAEGHVLTNKHVVPEGTSSVRVVMSDGTSYDNATIVGRDPLNDIAIIKVADMKDAVPAKLGDSDSVRTGQKVIAIGNALGQFQNTVTSGIISGIGRPVEAGDESGGEVESLTNLFQTDAAINSGNSGGPLLNYDGEVIGINTAIAADAQNIGFAIPINDTKGAIASVQTTGELKRPFLGVRFVMLSPSIAQELNVSATSGARVGLESGSVSADSPAAKAGLQPGDIIIKVDDTTIDTAHPLNSIIGRYMPGDSVQLTILRSGKTETIKVTLAEAPTTN